MEDCTGPECLDRIHVALDAWWSTTGDVGTVDRMLFELAVIEVAGNIVAHRTGSAAPACTLRVTRAGSSLEAEFLDNGDAVEIDLSALTLPGEDAEGGRGLALVRSAVDELSYDRVGGENRWLISRRLSP